MVSVVVFEFSVMRCQPLRRALGLCGLSLGSFLVIASFVLFCLAKLSNRNAVHVFWHGEN